MNNTSGLFYSVIGHSETILRLFFIIRERERDREGVLKNRDEKL